MSAWGLGVLAATVLAAGAQEPGPSLTAPEPLALVLPELPIGATGGGLVLLDLEVGADGQVAGTRILQDDPPFGTAVAEAARGWRFAPALGQWHTLVAALYHPPYLYYLNAPEATPAPEGTPPEIPYPREVVSAAFPPHAIEGGVVVLEALVDDQGSVSLASIDSSVPGLDEAAVEAALRWRFRPAREGNREVPSRVFLVFGFPTPNTLPVAVP